MVSATAVLALLVLATQPGCLWVHSHHECRIEFHATVLDGSTGQPVSGTAVRVNVGERIVYDGATDPNGELSFTHAVTCDHGSRFSRQDDIQPLSVTFILETGGFGTMEIPVLFEHHKRTLALGEIRLVPEEGQ